MKQITVKTNTSIASSGHRIPAATSLSSKSPTTDALNPASRSGNAPDGFDRRWIAGHAGNCPVGCGNSLFLSTAVPYRRRRAHSGTHTISMSAALLAFRIAPSLQPSLCPDLLRIPATQFGLCIELTYLVSSNIYAGLVRRLRVFTRRLTSSPPASSFIALVRRLLRSRSVLPKNGADKTHTYSTLRVSRCEHCSRRVEG